LASEDFRQIREAVWELAASGDMRVPVRVIAEPAILEGMKRDRTLQQARNVATLPGILRACYVMPDGHE
jgi:tRNA-splicing ligase RtcB